MRSLCNTASKVNPCEGKVRLQSGQGPVADAVEDSRIRAIVSQDKSKAASKLMKCYTEKVESENPL